MTTCFVIGFLATQASGAAGSPTEPLALSPQARELTASPRVAPEKCSASKEVAYYRSRLNYWAQKMGAGSGRGYRLGRTHRPACPRYLAHALQRKAHAARLAYLRWHRDQYEWWHWLPDKFARVGACETGYGKKPGNFHWDSGTYVSFAGIYRPAYEAYHLWTGRNTPREQFEVAAAIQARFGWGAWGCGGA